MTTGPVMETSTAAGVLRVKLTGMPPVTLRTAATLVRGQVADIGTGKIVGPGSDSVVGVAAPDEGFEGQVTDVDPCPTTKDALAVMKLRTGTGEARLVT